MRKGDADDRFYKGPRHAAPLSTYDDLFERMQEDAVAFATSMANAEAHPDIAFEDPRPYLRYDSVKSFPLAYYAIRSTTKYGGEAPLAGVCHELIQERQSSNWGRTAREFGLDFGLAERSRLAGMENQQIAILSMERGKGKLAVVTDHIHGYPVDPQAVLRSWTSDLAAARNKYLRG